MINYELPLAIMILISLCCYFGYIVGKMEKSKQETHDCREPKNMIIETSNHSGSHLTTYRCGTCKKIVHQVVK